MAELMDFLVTHGELVLFLVVFLGQAGLPLPATLLLVAAGALIGVGRLDPVRVVVLSTFAALLADLLWYEIGRRGGMRVLGLLCRISFEPDSCVRVTESFFLRHGLRALLVAKFIPALGSVAAPLMGIFRMEWRWFFVFDGLGSLLWIVVSLAVGYAFSDQLELVALYAGRLGMTLGAGMAVLLVGYAAYKYLRRWFLLRQLRVRRVTVEELRRLLEGSEPPLVLDLRHEFDHRVHPYRIPGALLVKPEEIADRLEELAEAGGVVTYCS